MCVLCEQTNSSSHDTNSDGKFLLLSFSLLDLNLNAEALQHFKLLATFIWFCFAHCQRRAHKVLTPIFQTLCTLHSFTIWWRFSALKDVWSGIGAEHQIYTLDTHTHIHTNKSWASKTKITEYTASKTENNKFKLPSRSFLRDYTYCSWCLQRGIYHSDVQSWESVENHQIKLCSILRTNTLSL